MNEERPYPIADREYPQTWATFIDWFPDEETCSNYLERLQWPDGFVCPSCDYPNEPFRTTRGRLTCRVCRHETTVTANTIFHRTRTPLRTWFATVWYVTNQKQGTSALGLQRVMGFKSYQTAWAHLHKLRRAMVRPDRDRLHGRVEVDESYIGGHEAGVRGRQTEKKAIVAVAIEVKEPRGLGRVRLRRVANVSEACLVPFVQDTVEPGATIHTDGWSSYNLLGNLGYQHEITVLSSTGDPAHVSMPGVHRVASLLKRWILGTHHGSFRMNQLDYYLDEFVFRFNRRTSRSRGLLFYRLLQQCVITEPAPFKNLVGGNLKNNDW